MRPIEGIIPPKLQGASPAPASMPATGVRPAAEPPRQKAGMTAGLDLLNHINQLHSKIDLLCRQAGTPRGPAMSQSLLQLFAELIDAEISEELARELTERVLNEPDSQRASTVELKSRLASMIANDLPIVGPIQASPGGKRVVALVGPTGVGKTTTIAKLAANFRLREKRRVGLITVDTYRIAAVDQLRTYADIMDLPMEIVATPREMQQALARMDEFDLVLMDTGGRSPGDEVKLQELKSMLAEAAPDEVHLVLSSVASARELARMAEKFAVVGPTALVLTKLDEAASLGHVLPLARSCRLPLSYLTHGQNVPDDIAPADADRLARIILGIETIGRPRAVA
jgi:flagellar biosynthesis protein FlhF